MDLNIYMIKSNEYCFLTINGLTDQNFSYQIMVICLPTGFQLTKLLLELVLMINDQINLLFLITVPIYAHTLRLKFFVCFVQPKIPILFGHVKKDIKQFCLYFDKKKMVP